jgi:putative membrane protein
MKKPILVLCVDRDNDLFEKARVTGPLIGRERNLEGAVALSLADPEDPDSNAIYYAVKLFDQMRKENMSVEIATLTGDKSLGYKADRNVSSQLDRVIQELNPSACILISDGASDEELVPIIKSRIKIDSTKIVFIKQAKELEKTYFVVLEKLKDPYFARIIIGIPAILILLVSLSSYFKLGLEPVGVIIGIYLLLRISNVDDTIGDVVKDFRFSFERSTWISYLGALSIFIIGAFVGYQTLISTIALGLSNEKVGASVLGSVIWIFFVGLILLMIGKSIDAVMEKKRYGITKYMTYTVAAFLGTLVISVGSMWIANTNAPYVDFGAFLTTIATALVIGYMATWTVNWYRQQVLIEMKIEGKEAISENGTYLGKIVGVDAKKGKLVIQTYFDKKFMVPVSSVSSIEENVIVKSNE